MGRMIDVRRAVVSLDAPGPGTRDLTRVLRRLEWDRSDDPDRDLVRFQLSVSTEGSAKPIEVIEGLWGPEVAAACSIARVALWGLDGDRLVDPLDADALRRVVALGIPAPADDTMVQDAPSAAL